MNDVVTASVLVIGDEILSGRTKDQNIGTIADHLTMIGIQLREVRVVPDDQDTIVAALNGLRSTYDYVFTTGGIGPTHDDITADSVAAAFGVGIDVDERALAIMKARYDKMGQEMTPPRLRMARIPDGADLIENFVSSAPGFMIENVIVMAGVPKIMQAMLGAVTDRLKTGRKMVSMTIPVNAPEGDVAELLGQTQEAYGDVSMGSYPSYRDGAFSVQLVLRSMDKALLSQATTDLTERLKVAGISFEDPR